MSITCKRPLTDETTKKNSFENISLCDASLHNESDHLFIKPVQDGLTLSFNLLSKQFFLEKDNQCLLKFHGGSYQYMPIFANYLVFKRLLLASTSSECDKDSFILRFSDSQGLHAFSQLFDSVKEEKCKEEHQGSTKKPKEVPNVSEFDLRTDAVSAQQYFQFYAYLFQQQNMMQDYVRTYTYQQAIHENYIDFQDKVVIDVGAGSGILSFFAVQALAKKVYAVEASSIAAHCRRLIQSNNMTDKIQLVTGRIEDVLIPEMVDVIISEPMGYMLVNERMLESFMNARRFLRPGGRMFPSKAVLYFSLFNDEALYLEQYQRFSFWYQENFHGVNLSALKDESINECFRQPIVDSWPVNILVSNTAEWTIDFQRDSVDVLHNIDVPFSLTVNRTCHVHGVASWFDVGFNGSQKFFVLSTSPAEQTTHWYQVRCLFKSPIMVYCGQTVNGRILMKANERQSYDIQISIHTNQGNFVNDFDLKVPHFRSSQMMAAASNWNSGGAGQQSNEQPMNTDTDNNSESAKLKK